MISLVRRAMPNLIAYDVCGVQPMNGPTGLIFAMKARYGAGATGSREALFGEAETQFSGDSAGTHDSDNVSGFNGISDSATPDGTLDDNRLTALGASGMPTADAESTWFKWWFYFQRNGFHYREAKCYCCISCVES